MGLRPLARCYGAPNGVTIEGNTNLIIIVIIMIIIIIIMMIIIIILKLVMIK